jgi:hypothetical protein
MHTNKRNKGRKMYAGFGYPKEVRAEAPIGIIWKATTGALTIGGSPKVRQEEKQSKDREVSCGNWSKSRCISFALNHRRFVMFFQVVTS